MIPDRTRIRTRRRRRAQSGIALIDCLVYCSLLVVIFWLSFEAFYRGIANARDLDRKATDISQVLSCGERWRSDVRLTVAPLQLTASVTGTVLHLPQTNGEVLYALHGNSVTRRAPTGTNEETILAGVQASRFLRDERASVTAWRWEIELQGKQKAARVKPLFTFQAVSTSAIKP